MLVYGDPQFKARVGCLRTHLQSLLEDAPTAAECVLDFWRKLLVQAGQLEQGIADLPREGRPFKLLGQAERLTLLAAEKFLGVWGRGERASTADLLQMLDSLKEADGLELRIKVPEGYEFYALFPEQYAASALTWEEHHAGSEDKNVLVVGVRSIGTSLSAVVSAVLQGRGWNVRRITVRPKGHPFERELALEERCFESGTFGLIVDEGPGISGSSMASVAEALMNGGIEASKLAFFPGHGNEPGHGASDKVREWWRTVPRFFTPVEQLKWSGKSLKDHLTSRTRQLLAAGQAQEGGISLEDVTGGGWLPLNFPDGKDWPPVFWPFERLKFRCVGPDGQAVLWKFSGLGALVATPDSEFAEMNGLAGVSGDEGSVVQTLPMIGATHGFICTRWIAGLSLRPAHAEAETLRMVASYLARTALPPLGAKEIADAVERLCRMLVCNSREQFGEESGKRAEEAVVIVRAKHLETEMARMPACADGRMAPHEWVRTKESELFKADSTANLVDHTLVGRQPLVWDIAGVITEWHLTPEQSEMFQGFLEEYEAACEPAVLEFYLAAYAAFKMGQSVLCLQMGSPDPEYKKRMQQAAHYYGSRLKATLYREAVQSLIESTRGP